MDFPPDNFKQDFSTNYPNIFLLTLFHHQHDGLFILCRSPVCTWVVFMNWGKMKRSGSSFLENYWDHEDGG